MGELVRLDLVHEQTAAGSAGPRFHRYPIEDLGAPDHHEVRPLVDDLADRLRQGDTSPSIAAPALAAPPWYRRPS
jgi:hypothetical protein